MFHLLALPSVGDVYEAVLGLNDSGIAKFFFWRVLKHQGSFPGLAILAHGEVQRAATFGGVVVDEQMTTIGKRDGVGAGVRVWQFGE